MVIFCKLNDNNSRAKSMELEPSKGSFYFYKNYILTNT
jgi:hypothetical protein